MYFKICLNSPFVCEIQGQDTGNGVGGQINHTTMDDLAHIVQDTNMKTKKV